MILILAVVERVEAVRAVRLPPSGWRDGGAEIGLHDDGGGVGLPGAAEVGLDLEIGGEEVGGGVDGAVDEGEAGEVVGVLAALSSDHVGLASAGAAGEDVAVLEDGEGAAEDEVDGAADVALAVELLRGVGVEGVLIALQAATVEDGVGRSVHHRHRLPLRRPRRVAERHADGHEPLSLGGCKIYI